MILLMLDDLIHSYQQVLMENLYIRFVPSKLVVSMKNRRICCSKGVKHLVDINPNMAAIPSQYVLPASLQHSSSPTEASIPLIDLHGLNGPPASRQTVVNSVASACSDWGFFRIVNHGIEERVVREMMNELKTFFDLPWEEKSIHASGDVMCPVRYGTSLNTSSPHPPHWRDYLRHYGHPFHNTFHLWPRSPPNYKEAAKCYLEEVWKLAMRIAGAVSESLGLERDYIAKSLGEGCQIVAANYYPPCPQPELTLGLAAHSDHGGLTILMQNEVDGLEVLHNDSWYLVRHLPGTFLVNVGDYLEVLSNGKYKSVEHRAVVDRSRARISVGVGHGPELSAIMSPAALLVEEGKGAKYKGISYGNYMNQQQSSVVRGKTALDAIKLVVE